MCDERGAVLRDMLAKLLIICLLASPALAAMTTYSGTVNLIPDCIAMWRLDETSGSTFSDNSGNGNTLTWQHGDISSDTAAAGNPPYLNNCVTFDGTNDYGQCAGAVVSGATSTMSVSLWFKTTYTGGNMGAIGNFSWGNGRSGFCVIIEAAGTYSVSLNYGKGDGSVATLTADYDCFTIGKWHHLVITFNSGTAAFYLDGESTGSDTDAGTIAASSQVMQVGREQNGNTVWNGSLDCVAIFDRVLTADEIEFLYNGGYHSHHAGYGTEDNLAGLSGNLIAHWKCNDIPSSVTVADSAGTNNGTYYDSGSLDAVVSVSSGSPPYLSTAIDLELDNTNYVLCDEATSLGDVDQSICLWCKPESTAAGAWLYATTDGVDGKLGIKLAGTNVLIGTIGTTANTASRLIMPDGEWSHVAIVYNHTADTLRYYLDGRDAGGADPANGTFGGSVKVHLGARKAIGNNNGAEHFDGVIDDVRVYDKALTRADVQRIYSGGLILGKGAGRLTNIYRPISKRKIP